MIRQYRFHSHERLCRCANVIKKPKPNESRTFASYCYALRGRIHPYDF
ncbi:hypothetical protein HMPREF1554_02339 [Porphyromonas gingivalis F0569]|nr:hypothetical protein HMPREF1554_02339 [Porphyromonas gingivalis F0569]